MKIVGIVQARLDSSRLPNKVLYTIGSQSMLKRVYTQAKASKVIDNVVVAIPNTPDNDVLANYCNLEKIPYYRGDKEDVLKRFNQYPDIDKYSHVVRITGDCPFISIELCDELISLVIKKSYLYGKIINNYVPIGSRVSIMTVNTLKYLNEIAKESLYREHLTLYLDEHFDNKKMLEYKPNKAFNYPQIRLTVDTTEDLITMNNIVNLLGESPSILDIIELKKSDPILFINGNIEQFKPKVRL